MYLISCFHSLCLDTPSDEDRSLFFDRLIEAALSIQVEATKKSDKLNALPDLPKAPKVSAGPKASELKVKAEAQGHALRRLRMCLRDVCNRYIFDLRKHISWKFITWFLNLVEVTTFHGGIHIFLYIFRY